MQENLYDLELEKVLKEIKRHKAKKVLIQLADGLKPRAEELQSYLKGRTDSEIYFWLNSCYGKCDLPEVKGFDLIVQFGH